jgi:hypothetical protein
MPAKYTTFPINTSTSAPQIAPSIEPRPPASEMPPITTAATEFKV